MVTYPNGVQSYISQQFKYSAEQPTCDEWKKAGKIKDRQIVRTILRFFAADKLLEADPARVEAMMDLIQETKENNKGQGFRGLIYGLWSQYADDIQELVVDEWRRRAAAAAVQLTQQPSPAVARAAAELIAAAGAGI